MYILEDVLLAARTVWFEGRGESYTGKRAIAHVLINRTDYKIGDADHSLAATSLRHRQFSGWNERDPNRMKVQKATVNSKVFRECLRAVLQALDEPDITNGSRHYMTKARRNRGWPRSWGPKREHTKEYGRHLFYNNVA